VKINFVEKNSTVVLPFNTIDDETNMLHVWYVKKKHPNMAENSSIL
jgi:hypothetical protein